MQKKTIALPGAKGNLGLDFLTAHLKSKEHSKAFDVIPITRKCFDNESLLPSTLRKIEGSDIIFLPVKPVDAVPLLILLKGSIKPGALVVSPVSGLSIHVIARILRIPYGRIVKMTQSVQMASNESIVTYSVTDPNTVTEVKRLFKGMAKFIIKRDAKDIPGDVVRVGSNSGIFAKHIMLCAQNSQMPFDQFLREFTMDNEEVRSFIGMMKVAFYKVFDRDDSLIEICYESTLQTLKKTCKSIEDIIKHINKVATEKGCTREGVDSIKSLDIISVIFLIRMISKMYKKVKSFERKIQKDFKKWWKFTHKEIPTQSLIPYI